MHRLIYLSLSLSFYLSLSFALSPTPFRCTRTLVPYPDLAVASRSSHRNGFEAIDEKEKKNDNRRDSDHGILPMETQRDLIPDVFQYYYMFPILVLAKKEKKKERKKSVFPFCIKILEKKSSSAKFVTV